jgi:asparagine synthase (glutamine-hydrolysing)
MCGIVGIAVANGGSVPDLLPSLQRLAHRGPDGSGIYADERFAIGHTRLAIIDPTETGAQPMRSADGRYVITYNGEIYNFTDLRNELLARGVNFRGSSDTEVLLEGFCAFGPDVVSKLNGIFSFCIGDIRTQELFIARDPLGVKPLYWAQGACGFLFASEIKALLAVAPVDRAIDDVAIMQYLTFLWCPGERTPFKSVRKLEPGTALFIRDGRVARTWRYWRLPDYAPRRDWTAQECANELGNAVTSAVERQLMSDAPLGAFLSGGLDSTAIVAAACKKLPDIHCFTMAIEGDVGEEMKDDLPYARLAAQELGVRLTEVPVKPTDISSGLSSMVAMLDEPLADPACIITNLISQAAHQQGIKVLLSGVGGDDLMSGYRRHSVAAYNSTWDVLPGLLRKQLSNLGSNVDKRSIVRRRLAKVLHNVDRCADDRLIGLFEWTPPHLVQSVLNKDRVAECDTSLIMEPLKREIATSKLSGLEKCLKLDQRFFLADHNLTYTDKMGMAAGVEIRVPLLDLELVSFASHIPSEWKHKGLNAKWIFKESQRGKVPDVIRNRPKAGFGVPLRKWIHGDLKEMTHDLTSVSSINRRGIFDAKAVQQLLVDDHAGREDAAYTLFSVMCIELWCRTFQDRL